MCVSKSTSDITCWMNNFLSFGVFSKMLTPCLKTNAVLGEFSLVSLQGELSLETVFFLFTVSTFVLVVFLAQHGSSQAHTDNRASYSQ